MKQRTALMVLVGGMGLAGAGWWENIFGLWLREDTPLVAAGQRGPTTRRAGVRQGLESGSQN